jgi:hypothetical protein
MCHFWLEFVHICKNRYICLSKKFLYYLKKIKFTVLKKRMTIFILGKSLESFFVHIFFFG